MKAVWRPKKYWFPAKRYGWGWGLPITWQGWVVLATYLVCIAAIVVAFPPATGAVRFVLLVAISSVVLTAVCWLTGEAPRWSWGKKRDT